MSSRQRIGVERHGSTMTVQHSDLVPVLVEELDQEQDNVVAQSFPDTRQKTLQTLYVVEDSTASTSASDFFKDKSPKGSVDDAIKPLVDLINCHPSFATLSSCSGRITLYDPNLTQTASHEQAIIQDLKPSPVVPRTSKKKRRDELPVGTESRTNSGKGSGGGWLLSSHEVVDNPNTLSNLMDDINSSEHQQDADFGDGHQQQQQPLSFKMEPLLLHVAACTLRRGRQLLSIALALGFRESGLVLSDTKVTVAIRGVSLSLSVPLARSGPLRPSRQYLEAILSDSNRRLEINLQKLQRLCTRIQDTLFQPRTTHQLLNSSFNASFSSIPPLNLWGHAAVAVVSTTSEYAGTNDCVRIFAFGGYGCGPNVPEDKQDEYEETSNKVSSRRSPYIYSLSRHKGLFWDKAWTKVALKNKEELHCDVKEKPETETTWYGVETSQACFSACEGLDACVLPVEEISSLGKNIAAKSASAPVIALLGGRFSPAKPCSNELLLFDPTTYTLASPVQVRGQSPSPRWGHTLTPLSPSPSKTTGSQQQERNNDGCLAILIGGRNTNSCVDDSIHVLSLVVGDGHTEGANHFMWEQISMDHDCFTPRFHHATLYMKESSNLIVFGGLSNPTNLVEPFQEEQQDNANIQAISVFDVNTETKTLTGREMKPTYRGKHDCKSVTLPCLFGASSACVMTSSQNNRNSLIFVCGGMPRIEPTAINHRSDEVLSSSSLYCFSTSNEIGHGSTDDTDNRINQLQLVSVEIASVTPQDATKNATLNFGSMVHHVALAVPSSSNGHNTDEVLFLGGGVLSFAFGPTFAENCRLQFHLDNSIKSDVDMLDNKRKPREVDNKQESSTVINATTKGQQVTDVLYVLANNAKVVKTSLERQGLLDKRYRMTKEVPEEQNTGSTKVIAIPVTKECMAKQRHFHSTSSAMTNTTKMTSQDWKSLVICTGKQVVPFSSAVLGQKAQQKKK